MKKIIAILCAAAMAVTAGASFAETAETAPRATVPEITGIKQYKLPDNEAFRFMRELKTGWDLGNTFDAYDDQGWFKGEEPTMETAWHRTTTTRELIAAVKEAGFNTIRIPVSWHNHVDEQFTINPVWLERVREVAGWAVDEGMYVIVNVHHDNSEAFFYPDSAHYESSAAYLSAIWGQMAEAFAEYDDHVILESMNEPRLVNTDYEWYFNDSIPECRDAAECINRLNQLFVDTVRAAGGNNATRYLSVPGYSGSPDGVLSNCFRIPEDTAENRIMIEVHAYRPYNFALNMGEGSVSSFNIDTDWQYTSDISVFMSELYRKFVSKGIPVIIDEYGALKKGDNLQDRVSFTAYYICSASARGMTCCLWDNCAFSGSGELFGVIDRKTCEWVYPEIVDAIMAYCTYNRQ